MAQLMVAKSSNTAQFLVSLEENVMARFDESVLVTVNSVTQAC